MSLGSNVAVRLVMLGPPGAGKGTQGARFARTHGLPKISTGDILREAVQAGTEMGRAAREVMDAGRLVGDDIMIEIVRERLERRDAMAGFVLDGFPRTVEQAQALDSMVDDAAPLLIVDIEVPEETLVKRLAIRRKAEMRADDNEYVVRERLKVYESRTRPIVDFYSRRATFRSIDGDQTEDGVAADLAAAVASALGAHR